MPAYPEIKADMKAKGIKQVHLANALGLTPDQISKSFAGLRRFTAAEMDVIRGMLANTAGGDVQGALPTREIPIVGIVPGGNWREAIQQPLGSIPMPADDIPPEARALRVVGDSMDKLVGDGGTVIFIPNDRDLYPDRYYVVINAEGETTFKQFKADPARLVPCSNNPKHRDIMMGDGNFEIVGRIEWYAGRLPARMP